MNIGSRRHCSLAARSTFASMVEIHLFRNESDTLDLAPGDVLLHRGDAADVMYAVVEGSIEISSDGTVFEVVGAGGIIGELSIVDQSPRSADAIATSPTRLARVDERRFVYLVQQHPTFALLVMRTMADRLRRRS